MSKYRLSAIQTRLRSNWLTDRLIGYLTVVLFPGKAVSLRQRFTSGASWSLASSVISRGMGLMAGVFVARLLGVAEYGELGLIRATILTLGVLSGYGLGLTSTKYIAELQHTEPERAGRIISMTTGAALLAALLATGIIWFGANWLTAYMSLPADSSSELRLASLLLVSNALWTVLQASMIGFQAFKPLAVNNLIYGIAAIISSVVLTYFLGLTGAILALIISASVGAVLAGNTVLKYCRRRGIRLRQKLLRRDFSVLFHFSVPAYLSGVLVLPITWWAYAQVSASISGTTEIGLFTAADQWRILILFIPQALGSITLPFLSEAIGASNKRAYNRTLFASLSINLVIAVTLCLGVIIFRGPITALYGSEFRNVDTILVILALVSIPQVLASVMGQVIASMSKMWWGVVLNGAWALAMILGISVIYSSTAVGLARSFLLAYIVLFVLTFAYFFVVRSEVMLKLGTSRT